MSEYEYALEGNPGRNWPTFPIYDTFEEAERQASAGIFADNPPRILRRVQASAWAPVTPGGES